MSKVYTIAFRMGVLFNVLLWTILNLISFFNAQNDYLYWKNQGIKWSHTGDFDWGVPFTMFVKHELYFPQGLLLNTIVYVVCGFFFGFLFKFVWSKISRRESVLK